jgi:hypothetical protein
MATLFVASPSGAQQAQQQGSGPALSSRSQSQADGSADDKDTAGQGQNTVNKDRLFGVLPNYATVENEHQFGPLTVKDKFKLTQDSMLDPVTFPFIGFVALLGQAENTEPSYGQGLIGYAKRYGTSYADSGIGTMMTTSVFPSLLHQDPRYFQLGRGTIVHRTLYSVGRIFITRNDSGSHGFNYSEIVGNAVAAGISNAYHPQDERTLSNTASVWATDIMWDTASNVAKEFWPDIRRKLHHDRD